MPYFSIIIPLYNREKLISRAISSCFNQDFQDFEIIVVDDGSTDGSCDAVKRINDPRLRLIRHEKNRGVCPARNTGIANARGEWILPFDSDDELLPNVLAMVHHKTVLAQGISMIRFMNRTTTGELSPDPPLKNEIWDYEGYIRWTERSLDANRSDASKVFRRECFKLVKYPETRALEAMFHLDFSHTFKTLTCAESMVLIHEDANNRLTQPDISRAIMSAPAQIKDIERLLAVHGEAMLNWAPRKYFEKVCGLATLQFMAGDRFGGGGTVLRALKLKPLSVKGWAVLIFGLLGARPLAKLQAIRLQRLRRKLKR